jgi:hypothetical protein
MPAPASRGRVMWMLVIAILANPHDSGGQARLETGPMPRERCLALLEDVRSSYDPDRLLNAWCWKVG